MILFRSKLLLDDDVPLHPPFLGRGWIVVLVNVSVTSVPFTSWTVTAVFIVAYNIRFNSCIRSAMEVVSCALLLVDREFDDVAVVVDAVAVPLLETTSVVSSVLSIVTSVDDDVDTVEGGSGKVTASIRYTAAVIWKVSGDVCCTDVGIL